VNRRRFLGLAAGAALVRPSALLAAPPPLAAATCDEEDRIAIVDARAGRVVRTVPCLPDPRSIERVGPGDALVCHTNVGAVTILDGSTLSVRHVLREFEEPRYTAAHPDGRHAFVTDSGLRRLAAVDVRAGRVLGHVSLPEWPRHLSLDSAGTTLWVGLGNAADRIAVVDVSEPARPAFVSYVHPPFPMHDVGFTPDGLGAWVTSGTVGELAVYRADGAVRLRLPADEAPQHVSFAGELAYVTSGGSGTLHVATRDGRIIRSTRIPVGSYNVQAGRGLVLTPSLDGGTLTLLDRSGRILHQVVVGRSSHDACFVG
jgi:DNA-binding beta-propeller fold protein YncE